MADRPAPSGAPANEPRQASEWNGPAIAKAAAGTVGPAAQGAGARKGAARPRRDAPAGRHDCVREVGVLVADGEAYRLEVPVPPRTALGRQPHGVAMRFIDCLFGRCRAPLDLTLEEDPENDAPGGRPGADMLCCGMRTRALKSYCDYHQVRLRRRVFEAAPG